MSAEGILKCLNPGTVILIILAVVLLIKNFASNAKIKVLTKAVDSLKSDLNTLTKQNFELKKDCALSGREIKEQLSRINEKIKTLQEKRNLSQDFYSKYDLDTKYGFYRDPTGRAYCSVCFSASKKEIALEKENNGYKCPSCGKKYN